MTRIAPAAGSESSPGPSSPRRAVGYRPASGGSSDSGSAIDSITRTAAKPDSRCSPSRLTRIADSPPRPAPRRSGRTCMHRPGAPGRRPHPSPGLAQALWVHCCRRLLSPREGRTCSTTSRLHRVTSTGCHLENSLAGANVWRPSPGLRASRLGFRVGDTGLSGWWASVQVQVREPAKAELVTACRT